MSDMAMPPVDDLGNIRAQLEALQQSDQQRDEADFLSRVQSGLSAPDSKYNYTKDLGADLLGAFKEEGVDLKSASMEIVQAKLDEMDASLQSMLSSLDEYRRSYKRDIDNSIRQVEDAVDELSRVKDAVSQVNTADETVAEDSVPEIGAPPPEAPMDPMATDPNMGMPMDPGIAPPPVDPNMGMPAEAPMAPPPEPMPPPPVPQPQYAEGGYVNPRLNQVRSLLQKKRNTVLSDKNKKVIKPSRAILAGVLNGV
jgi:hypothetical protein